MLSGILITVCSLTTDEEITSVSVIPVCSKCSTEIIVPVPTYLTTLQPFFLLLLVCSLGTELKFYHYGVHYCQY